MLCQPIFSRLPELDQQVYRIIVPEDHYRLWQTFVTQRDLAHKILDDQQRFNGGDRILSMTDPDARRAKHGQWFNERETPGPLGMRAESRNLP